MAGAITKRTYVVTGAALLGLLAVSLVTAELPLGRAGLPVALGIAAVKVMLVAIFFMHLRTSSRTAWLFAGAGLFWLAILMALTLGDYFTRG